MSSLCKWLHKELERLPEYRYDYNEKCLPLNGIYFFYEEGENCYHYGDKQRIVRIGTSNDGNFRKRIKEHFLIDRSKKDFERNKSKPSDRSIFRKNIGRVLLKDDDYLCIWERDFQKKDIQKKYGRFRDIEKERKTELEITNILRKQFSFRFICLSKQIKRKGCKGLEGFLIGTVARCDLCKPSKNWLGKKSPESKIVTSGLWQVQCLEAREINEVEKRAIQVAVNRTIE